jgi:hypothetical protein
MQLNRNLLEDQSLDDILKEAAEGYGDLMAAALIHKVNVEALQSRLRELQHRRAPWIS